MIIEYRSRYHMKRVYTDVSYMFLEEMMADDLKGLWFLKNPDEKIYIETSDLIPFSLYIPKSVHYIRITEKDMMLHSTAKKYKSSVKNNKKGWFFNVQEMIEYITKEY